jgi:hypothetical protein
VPISWELRPKELVVDARSRMPSRRGGCRGEEFDEARDLWDAFLNKLMPPGSAKDKAPLARAALLLVGAWFFIGLSSVCRRCSAVADAPLAFGSKVVLEARGVGGPSCCGSWPGGGILTGSGKSELRFLFRRASLKKVVCVETVWVVVVVEP